MKTFRANGFNSIQPDGWEDRSTLTLVGPLSGDGFASNIVITRQYLQSNSSLAQFAKVQLATLEEEVQDLDIADEREVTLNGRTIYQRLHRFSVGKQRVSQVQTYLEIEVGNRLTVFVITGTTSPQAFDAAMPAFKLFVENFEPE